MVSEVSVHCDKEDTADRAIHIRVGAEKGI
jgi:hypothetical protein